MRFPTGGNLSIVHGENAFLLSGEAPDGNIDAVVDTMAEIVEGSGKAFTSDFKIARCGLGGDESP